MRMRMKMNKDEDEDELSVFPSTGNTAKRSRILLAKQCPPEGGGQGSWGGLPPHRWPCTISPPCLAQTTALNPRTF